ncbi:MAG TPA: hypothetical protein ENJ46_04615, partial [Hellea balneolensis]|nr:hypothetical protein [Hellea balneolensis]
MSLVLLCIAGTASTWAWAADPFVVTNVHVDASADNALEARNFALSQGRTEAANILLARMSLQSDRDKTGITQIATEDGARMIRALEIANEKRSGNRYLADITVAFNAQAVEQYMSAHGLRMVSTQSRKRLVVPLLNDSSNWANNEWTYAWEKRGYENLLTPLVVINQASLQSIVANP